jgi:hypothetical protein
MADPSHSSPAAADSLLAPPPASDAPEAAALPAAAGPDLDAEFGFQRPELGKEKLAGTVGFHQRHVFLCYKSPAEWPSHVEATDSDRLPRILAAAIKARKSNLNKSVSISTSLPAPPPVSLADCLISCGDAVLVCFRYCYF